MSDKGAFSLTTINKRLIENKSSPYYIYKTNKFFTGESKLFIKNVKIIKDKEGKKELYIELDEYQLDIDRINIKDKYKDKVKKILSNDSLSLIDFIGIDMDYDGKTPIISWQYYRMNDKLNIDAKIKIRDKELEGSKKIFIRCIDVFGFQCSNILEINDERVVICQES